MGKAGDEEKGRRTLDDASSGLRQRIRWQRKGARQIHRSTQKCSWKASKSPQLSSKIFAATLQIQFLKVCPQGCFLKGRSVGLSPPPWCCPDETFPSFNSRPQWFRFSCFHSIFTSCVPSENSISILQQNLNFHPFLLHQKKVSIFLCSFAVQPPRFLNPIFFAATTAKDQFFQAFSASLRL